MILIIIPFYDLATGISFNAGLHLENFCRENHILYKTLTALGAYRAIFESTMLFDKHINFIAYFGHGEKDGLLGQHLFSKMLDTNNDYLVKDTIIYTMACWSGAILGPDTIAKGGISYFGQNYWYYGAIANEEYSYFNDWIDYVTIIPRELLHGKTALEALNSYHSLIDKYLNKYENNKYLDWDWYYTTTKSNKDHLSLIGNENGRIII